MPRIFDRPIPGQSLTVEPKNQAYERPPEITDPIEALDIHIEKLLQPDAMEDVLYFLESGVDLVTMVQGILRSAVMEGIHSIDVSLIIAPVLHEHIKGFADVANLDYEEGFENQEGKKALAYRRDVARAKKMIGELPGQEDKATPTTIEQTTKEPEMEVEEQQQPAKTGLMVREV